MVGYVKLYRNILNWRWYDDISMTRIFLHLLLKANFQETIIDNQIIPAGSLITSYRVLAMQTSYTISQVRRTLKNLQITGEITLKKHSKYSVISINNWDKYQFESTQNNTVNNILYDMQSAQISTHNLKNPRNIKKEKDIIINNIQKEKRFCKPQMEDVADFIFSEKHLSEHECEKIASEFVDFYTSNGWMVGQNHMIDWQASTRNWLRNKGL